jgi:hypothetical protein
MIRRLSSPLARTAPYGVLLLFTAALLWPLCIGRSLYWGDITLYFRPMLGFHQEELRQGRLPLWNPYILGGQPFLGNPQMGVFYPMSLLLPFLPVQVFLSLNSVLHLFLCGAFMYLFLCRWTVRRVPALAGAIVYMGSACLVSRLQFPPMIQTAAYFPLLLVCLDGCLDRSRHWEALFGVAITVGLLVLAAHPQIAYLSLVCSLCYALMRLLSQWHQGWGRREKGEARWVAGRLLPLIAAGAVGLLLTSVQILPALQLLTESPREEMTTGQANRFFLEPMHLLTLIAPRFFGNPASGDYWGGGNAWEPTVFVGWLPLLCIGYAVARCGREALVRFWAVVALLGLWLALGTAGGLYWLAFNVVPGLSNFHDPARFLFLMTFSFAVLSAVGLDALRARTQARARWRGAGMSLLALPGVALPLWWYGQDWNPTISGIGHRVLEIRSGLIPRPGVGRLYLPAHELYWNRYIKEGYSDYGPTDARYLTGLRDTWMPNLGMEARLEAASGYEPVPISAPAALDGLSRLALKRGEPNLSRLLSLLNGNPLVLPVRLPAADPRLQAAGTQAQISLWRDRDALPRAWLVRKTRHIEGKMRISAALAAPDFQPSETAIVSGQEGDRFALEWGSGGVRALPTAPVTLREETPVYTDMQADAGAAPAYLVYASTAYPGWRVTVDGRPSILSRTNGANLGVALPPGVHRIVFRYLPDVYRVGLYLSLLACGALAAAAGLLRRPGRAHISAGKS